MSWALPVQCVNWVTHRPLSSSFLGLPCRILNISHKKALLRGLWVRWSRGSRLQAEIERRTGFALIINETSHIQHTVDQDLKPRWHGSLLYHATKHKMHTKREGQTSWRLCPTTCSNDENMKTIQAKRADEF